LPGAKNSQGSGVREAHRLLFSVRPAGCRGQSGGVSGHIRTLLRRAKELGVMVHFDMEQYQYKALTLAILKDILLEEEFRKRDDIGVTLQAYLRDSYEDLQDLVNWAKQRGTPVTVRLVKGPTGTRKPSPLARTTGPPGLQPEGFHRRQL
jgi:hypothetical protein